MAHHVPVMEFVDPDMVRGNIGSFIERYKKNHEVRDAFVAGIDMNEEQGRDNVDNVIADAYVKRLSGVNWEEAYQVVKHDADFERKGFESLDGIKGDKSEISTYREKGWIPAGIMSCSKTLEFAYNDYCVAEMARGLDKMSDYREYLKRSTEWENLWNPKATSDGYNGFIVPRNADGTWVNIDPKKNWGSWHDYFYEGSSWTYSFFVPHEFDRLVSLCGGKKEYAARLQHALENGLIDYSNEPAFLAIHTFHYAGRSDLASFWVHKLMSSGYTMNGYPGNDDSGAMSSWFVFAAMGFFPNAGQDFYYLHSPSFSSVTIHLENGKSIRIIGENASSKNIYVQSLRVDGEDWNRPYITHAELMHGAVLDFVMGDEPSYWTK
ncbi:MAG TPA: glycoside hydrolase family 92 protein [Candidatus Kryptobacter bacterium]|nr:glycoside hydrolase family 92 protein [Candidatus Kryptobacter bacterium]